MNVCSESAVRRASRQSFGQVIFGKWAFAVYNDLDHIQGMTTTQFPFAKYRSRHGCNMRLGIGSIASVVLLGLAAAGLRADQVEMQNGDRYLGKVLSLTTDKLVIQSEVLGKLTLPRDKVALITLGAVTNTNAVQASAPAPISSPPVALTGSSPDLSSALRNLGSNTNMMEQVRGQLLAGAGADANKKFDELLGGLASGKLDLEGIRSEARSAASQLRALKEDLGPDASEPLDAYLNILDNFLKEASPPTGSVPGRTVARPSTKPEPE
jgi:hypothetical protein